MMAFLCRHGQTFLGEKKALQGQINTEDTLLNKEGFENIEEVSNKLRNKKIDLIITSPLLRCIQTSTLISKNISSHPKIIIDEKLKEISYGEWEGLTKREIEEKWPGELAKRESVGRWFFKVPKGESYNDVFERSKKWWEEKGKHLSPRVLIVSHNVFGMCLRRHIFNLNEVEATELSRDHGEVWELNNTILK